MVACPGPSRDRLCCVSSITLCKHVVLVCCSGPSSVHSIVLLRMADLLEFAPIDERHDAGRQEDDPTETSPAARWGSAALREATHEVCREMRRDRFAKNIPIVAL